MSERPRSPLKIPRNTENSIRIAVLIEYIAYVLGTGRQICVRSGVTRDTHAQDWVLRGITRAAGGRSLGRGGGGVRQHAVDAGVLIILIIDHARAFRPLCFLLLLTYFPDAPLPPSAGP
jgi:hypothetical protein